MHHYNSFQLFITSIFLFNLSLAEEEFSLSNAQQLIDSSYSMKKHIICSSFDHENEMQKDKQDFITYTEVSLNEDLTPGAPKSLSKEIRLPTSVAIQEQHLYREEIRSDFKETVNNTLFVLNQNPSVKISDFKKLKSTVLELEILLGQSEEKLCSKVK